MNRFLEFITNTYFLSLILTLVILLSLSPRTQKYRTVLLDEDVYVHNQRVYYYDLNGDGISERIFLGFNKYSGLPFVLFSTINNKAIEQWNPDYNWILRSDAMFADCNNNGLSEIYVFTQHDDSVFLNGYELFTDSVICSNRLIEVVNTYSKGTDFDIFIGRTQDLNNDGQIDLPFIINSGYSLFPRTLYIYDPLNDKLLKSPSSGALLPCMPDIVNLDQDKEMEILLRTYASGNMNREDIPYPDSSSWLMLLDHHNDFVFNPVENKGFASGVLLAPMKRKDECRITACFQSGSHLADTPPLLIKYHLSGKTINKRHLSELGEGSTVADIFYKEKPEGTVIFLLDKKGNIYELQNDLDLEKKHFPYEVSDYIEMPYMEKNNFLFWSRNKQSIYLFSNNLKNPKRFAIKNEGGKLIFNKVSLQNNAEGYSIQTGKNWQLFKSEINPLYFFRWVLIAGIAAIIFFLIRFIKQVHGKQLMRRHISERRVLELQMTTLKGQLHPHFTLNVLNSIGGLYHEQKDMADYYFGKYAKLIRNTMLAADKVSIHLREEIEFIRNYLELEKFRFKGTFDYHISNHHIPEVYVPKLLIHTFVENAVKHGMRSLKSGGLINISIAENHNRCIVRILDNGGGFNNHSSSSYESTGQGLKIVDQMITIYNQLYKHRIEYDLKEVVTDKNKKGTEVIVRIYFTGSVNRSGLPGF